MRQFFGARGNALHVDEEFLLGEVLRTRTGDGFSPGDATASPNWPGVAPGTRGILNAMSPRWYDASAFSGLERKPPVTWVRGGQDQVVSDTSMFDLGYLGQLGAVPGWPGDGILPPQPMEGQTRAVLDAYRAGGGTAAEIVLPDAAHGMPVEVPEQVAAVIAGRLVR
jgi:pimeloyl-ACP methyl ester carboxylesterase